MNNDDVIYLVFLLVALATQLLSVCTTHVRSKGTTLHFAFFSVNLIDAKINNNKQKKLFGNNLESLLLVLVWV